MFTDLMIIFAVGAHGAAANRRRKESWRVAASFAVRLRYCYIRERHIFFPSSPSR